MPEHLDALRLRLSNERERVATARSAKEIELRKVWIRQIENEIAQEENRLHINAPDADMSDDQLLAELVGETPRTPLLPTGRREA